MDKKPFIFTDARTGKTTEASVVGDDPQTQIVVVGAVAMKLADAVRFAELVFTSGDLGDETDPRRAKQRDIAKLQLGEGRRAGAMRFKPDRDRIMAGTATGFP